jgi:hypothetical protein
MWTYFKSLTGWLHGDREGGTGKANGEASVKKEPKKSPSTPPWHLISKARDMMTLDTMTEAEEEVEGKSSAKTPGFPWNILKSGREKELGWQVYCNGCQQGCGGGGGEGDREG